jgi:hypothetical protein
MLPKVQDDYTGSSPLGLRLEDTDIVLERAQDGYTSVKPLDPSQEDIDVLCSMDTRHAVNGLKTIQFR